MRIPSKVRLGCSTNSIDVGRNDRKVLINRPDVIPVGGCWVKSNFGGVLSARRLWKSRRRPMP